MFLFLLAMGYTVVRTGVTEVATIRREYDKTISFKANRFALKDSYTKILQALTIIAILLLLVAVLFIPSQPCAEINCGLVKGPAKVVPLF